MDCRGVIKKWYQKIGFDSKYDKEFYEALETIEIDPAVTVEDYDLQCTDGKKNFLSFLYFCEELERQYEQKGIDKAYLYDNLTDFPRWLNTWSDLKGELYLGELDWFIWHFRMKLFKIGRLQFNMNGAKFDAPEYGLRKGDPVIDMHIPASGPLLKEECVQSVAMAREFFAKFYPEYHFDCFTCSSWLLWEGLSEYLGENSNILKFQKLFDIVETEKRDSIISFVLRWQTKREDVGAVVPKSEFARKVKEKAMAGEAFYVGKGVIRK